ncbi:1511_t:CDS:1 [Scutellospora calospora]|uniref:1511_t:CDS:1 n=1 Tax=Scutellospora calospora TaxID=85575 RepID=A0ACA9KLJ7_9GLOM|nr:1511_t:CDS:1 [Scutellospora calospora]
MDRVNRVQNLVAQIQTQAALQRIFNPNLNLFARNLKRANSKKHIVAYNLLRMIINDEGLLINETDCRVISQSANMIWNSFTPAEKNIFKIYAAQIRTMVGVRN